MNDEIIPMKSARIYAGKYEAPGTSTACEIRQESWDQPVGVGAVLQWNVRQNLQDQASRASVLPAAPWVFSSGQGRSGLHRPRRRPEPRLRRGVRPG